jgi:hypothetical protein
LIYYCFPQKECWEPHHAAFYPKKKIKDQDDKGQRWEAEQLKV